MTAPAWPVQWPGSGECCPAGDAVVKVGVEAAGHYHRPLLDSAVAGRAGRCWSSTRRMSASSGGSQGRRRVKTDAIDLEAITELVLAGRGLPVTAREEVIVRADGVGGAPDPPGRRPGRRRRTSCWDSWTGRSPG